VAVVFLAAALASVVAQQRADMSYATSGIVATWDVNGEIYRTHIENPDTIDQVYALQNGESTASIPVGRLRSGEEYNEGWSWHTDPQEIEMADFATEVCDGLPSHVEADQDYWINTVQYYCPWSAVLVDILPLGVGGVTELVGTPGSSDGSTTSVVLFIAGGAAAAAALVAAAVWSARRSER
jgi:hypothetical protein